MPSQRRALSELTHEKPERETKSNATECGSSVNFARLSETLKCLKGLKGWKSCSCLFNQLIVRKVKSMRKAANERGRPPWR
jgi:hypothetical protein